MEASKEDNIVIPAKVRYDKRLPANARLLYGDLLAKHGEINLGFMPPWIIIGAETGSRKDKKIPKREWIESIVLACTEEAVFMKESLRPVWGDNLIQKYPW